MKLALLLGCAHALSVQEQYSQFLATYGRPWRSNGLKAFADTLERIGNNPTLGINQFSDLTPAEFRALYLTPALNDLVEDEVNAVAIPRSFTDPPASIDWRTKGVVPPVEEQGQQSDVVVYVAADNLASAEALVKPPLVPPSSLVAIRNFLTKCIKCPPPQPTFECLYGGVVNNSGVCSSYTNDCHCKPDMLYSSFKSLKDEANLLNAVALGPVAAYVNAQPWQEYRGGVFTGKCPADVDHAVLVVGYGTEGATPYWILKNSWGTSWGEQGYMRLKRGTSGPGQCGVAVEDAYPVGEK